MEKSEKFNELASLLEDKGITKIGNDGEIMVKLENQASVANALEKIGFGMIIVSSEGNLPNDKNEVMFRIITGPKSITDIIDSVIPENQEDALDRIKRDPVIRAVQMNMIAFD